MTLWLRTIKWVWPKDNADCIYTLTPVLLPVSSALDCSTALCSNDSCSDVYNINYLTSLDDKQHTRQCGWGGGGGGGGGQGAGGGGGCIPQKCKLAQYCMKSIQVGFHVLSTWCMMPHYLHDH